MNPGRMGFLTGGMVKLIYLDCWIEVRSVPVRWLISQLIYIDCWIEVRSVHVRWLIPQLAKSVGKGFSLMSTSLILAQAEPMQRDC